MYADNEFLIALSNKLTEMADNTADIETKNELQELAELAVKQCELQTKAIKAIMRRNKKN